MNNTYQNNEKSLKLKIKFSISDLVNYAYQHAPVKSMSNRPPLEEIITTQPLINEVDNDPTHLYYLTYIYYKTTSMDGKPILNGYGYITCNFFNESSIRSVFTVTDYTTRILSGELFGLNNTLGPIGKTVQHNENVYFYNNDSEEVIKAILTINGDIVTIEG